MDWYFFPLNFQATLCHSLSTKINTVCSLGGKHYILLHIQDVVLHDIAQLEIIASHCDTRSFVLQIDAYHSYAEKFSWLTFKNFNFLEMDRNEDLLP